MGQYQLHNFCNPYPTQLALKINKDIREEKGLSRTTVALSIRLSYEDEIEIDDSMNGSLSSAYRHRLLRNIYHLQSNLSLFELPPLYKEGVTTSYLNLAAKGVEKLCLVRGKNQKGGVNVRKRGY